MDHNQLKTFAAVAYTGNLTQAAERLHLSQPAVSAQIKSLEQKLDTALFTRTSSGMTLTPAGQVFLPEAEALLQHHHRLDCFAKTLSAHRITHAEIGLIHPVDPDKTTRLTRAVLQREPDILLHIQYGMSGEIEERILSKQIHGGFFLGPVTQRSLNSIWLEDIHYTLICPASEAETLSRDGSALNRCAWIEMSGVSGSRKNMQQFWRRHKIKPKHQIICDYPQTIIDLVCAGTGVAIVPASKAEAAAAAGKPLAVLDEYRQTLPMHFVYLNEHENDPVVQLLTGCLNEVWNL
ncbi:LysR family transcriptional regulator [Neisseria sp.]|uniref:LysR family transcriptional regulator n=1 Tax=Neisseria sp. TaxID=192066 RepID=UPI0035A1191C